MILVADVPHFIKRSETLNLVFPGFSVPEISLMVGTIQ